MSPHNSKEYPRKARYSQTNHYPPTAKVWQDTDSRKSGPPPEMPSLQKAGDTAWPAGNSGTPVHPPSSANADPPATNAGPAWGRLHKNPAYRRPALPDRSYGSADPEYHPFPQDFEACSNRQKWCSHKPQKAVSVQSGPINKSATPCSGTHTGGGNALRRCFHHKPPRRPAAMPGSASRRKSGTAGSHRPVHKAFPPV